MTSPLLETKFHIPAPRVEDVSRLRLLRVLENGLRAKHKLTLVSAPAGYGKTTLISAWLHSEKNSRKISWLSLDDGDNELIRFLSYWASNFHRVDQILGLESQHLLGTVQSLQPITVMDALINELAGFQHSIIVVLDDYHIINNPKIHETLEHFIEHQPANIHLIIITRQDPPLPLARMRARRQMTEIRAQHLRFTQEEAHQFFTQSMQLNLTEEATTALEERTEGWAAGLQLAGLALQNLTDPQGFIETFRGSHRYVLDYLAEEVIRQQGDEVRTFLTQTSVLDRFNANACSALTDRTDSQSMIDRLERSNLFVIPLDDERRWYRYHHLFADYLQSLLTKSELSVLYRKASTWHEANGLTSEAVRYALASSDMEFATDAIERALKEDATWSGFNLGVFTSWLEALPDQVLHIRPRLCLDAAHVFYAAGQLGRSESFISHAERSIERSPDREQVSALAMLYRGLIAAVRGEFQQAIEQITAARTRIPRENHLAHSSALYGMGQAYNGLGENDHAIECLLESSNEARSGGMLFPMVNSRCAAARLQVTQGRLSLAEQTCWDAIHYAENVRLPQLGLAWSLLGSIALERNNLVDAEKFLQDGLTLSREAHLNDDITWGLIYLARLRIAQGNSQDAIAAIQEAQNIVQAYGIPRLSLVISAHVAHMYLVTGQNQRGVEWAQEYTPLRGENPIDHAELTLARILMHSDKADDVTKILHSLLEKATPTGRVRTCIEAMALLGVFHHTKGDATNAVEWIGKALQLAEPEGYTRLFLDEGQPLLDLLPRARRFAPGLVDSIRSMEQAESKSRSVSSQQLPDPLSGQEIRVLNLIIAGKSNAEIADELVISIGTAKWHVHNVLQKLGAGNRAQAIARARELGQ